MNNCKHCHTKTDNKEYHTACEVIKSFIQSKDYNWLYPNSNDSVINIKFENK
jgi:hypothetical protein